MSEKAETENSQSHTGWWIGGGIFLVLFYFLIPPFLFKGLLICGMNPHDANEITETVFFPIVYLAENNMPGADLLEDYYDACAKMLGL